MRALVVDPAAPAGLRISEVPDPEPGPGEVLVLDNVGGRLLVDAWGLVKLGGSVQNIGWTSGEPAVFEPYSLFAVARRSP